MKTNQLKLGLNFLSRFTSYLKPVKNPFRPPYNKKPVSSSSTKFVLSFDGGGVRGLAAAVFLKALEKETGMSISKHFDLFMGVSAGGLSASFLAFNQTSAEELESFWSVDNLNLSMKRTFWDKALYFNNKPKYTNAPREALLKKHFSESFMDESAKPLVLLAYDIERRTPLLMSSYGERRYRVFEAVMASSAAPLLYPTVKMESGEWLIDGGVVDNNPSLIAYVEAKKLFGADRVKVLSIGSGVNKKRIDGSASADWGPMGWLKNDVLGLLLESQMDHELLMALIGEDYLRINSPMRSINADMDDSSDSNLKMIRNMGEMWWSQFGDDVKKFLEI